MCSSDLCQTQKTIPVRIITNRPRRVYVSGSDRGAASDATRLRRQPKRDGAEVDDAGFTKVSRGKARPAARA